MDDVNAQLKQAGMLDRLKEWGLPQTYLAANLADFSRNRQSVRGTNKICLMFTQFRGNAWIDLLGSCSFHSFDHNNGQLIDAYGDLNVRLNPLTIVESQSLREGHRLYDISFLYNPQIDQAYLLRFSREPRQGRFIPQDNEFGFQRKPSLA